LFAKVTRRAGTGVEKGNTGKAPFRARGTRGVSWRCGIRASPERRTLPGPSPAADLV